eukprot:scaffold102668_cov23-Tisochrysis_lutea.AAC.1
MGRQPAMTKLSSHVAVRKLRVRGGNEKFRALRLDSGNFAWPTEVGRATSFFPPWQGTASSRLIRAAAAGAPRVQPQPLVKA